MELVNGQIQGGIQVPFGIDHMVPMEAQRAWPKTGTRPNTKSSRQHTDGKTYIVTDDHGTD